MTRYAKTMSQALAEMKMNDPKLNKIFDKLKKGDKIKLKTSSVASRGSDFVEYIVKSKNVVNKGRVEKITLATVGNEKAVKKFLYRRDGKVTFAMGDMAASIDDIKEEIEEGTWKYAETPKEIAALKKLMSRPLPFGKEGENATSAVYNLLGDDELSDMLYADGEKNPKGDARKTIIKWFKQRVKDDSYGLGDETKELGKKIGLKMDYVPEEVELTEKVSKELALATLSMNKNQKFVKVSGDFVPEIYLSAMDRDKLKKEFGRLPRGFPNQNTGMTVVSLINYALGNKDGRDPYDTEDGDSKSPKLYNYDTGKVVGKPKTVGDAARMAGLRLESVELDEVTMSKALDIDPKDVDRMKTLAVLYTRAMKLPAGSPKQDKFKKEIEKLRKELGMNESAFKELVKSVELDEMFGISSNSNHRAKTMKMLDGMGVKYKKDGRNGLIILGVAPKDQKGILDKIHKDIGMTTYRIMDEEVELDEKYDLYHKTFSDAMQHAYDYAKKKLGITVDSKEIDNKVATGPKKPSEGKTNKYRLKGKGGNLQIQVYNKGGSKPFELNMYKEENKMYDKLTDGNLSLKETVLKLWQEAAKDKDEGNAFGAALQAAKEKGEKTFTVAGKEYDVKTEKLVGGQKKLDKDKDGDIDGKDFAMMRKKKKTEDVEEERYRYLETKKGSLRDAVLQMWGEKKDLTKEMENGKNKKTDTGKEMTPVDMSPKMPKVKESKNKV